GEGDLEVALTPCSGATLGGVIRVLSRRALLGAFGTALFAACAPAAPTAKPTTPVPDETPTVRVEVATVQPASPTPVPAATPEERALRLFGGEKSWTARARGADVTGLDDLLASIAKEVAQPARDARTRINGDGSVQFTPAQAGLALDQPASAEKV